MSCSRYQFEMSQCLDGRLTSSRRREVMAHTDRCARCAVAWDEMQEAQSLTFQLKPPAVAVSFRNTVWDRVQSGEGTPEVLLQEPVNLTTKLQYGLIGAAATAVFLVGYSVWFASTAAPIPDQSVASNEESALGGNSNNPFINNNRSRAVQSNFLTEPLTAVTLANHTIGEVAGAATRLKLRRGTVLANPANTPGGVWLDIRNDVQVLGDGLQFLGSLEKENFVEFQGQSRQCMEQARIALVTRGKDRQSIQVLVQTLSSCPLDGLENGLRFHARATHFNERLLRVMQQDRVRISRMFANLQLMPQSTSQIYGNQGQQQLQFFIIRNNQSGVQTLERIKRPNVNIQLLTNPDNQQGVPIESMTLKKRSKN
jgi:hypothetical protein